MAGLATVALAFAGTAGAASNAPSVPMKPGQCVSVPNVGKVCLVRTYSSQSSTVVPNSSPCPPGAYCQYDVPFGFSACPSGQVCYYPPLTDDTYTVQGGNYYSAGATYTGGSYAVAVGFETPNEPGYCYDTTIDSGGGAEWSIPQTASVTACIVNVANPPNAISGTANFTWNLQ